MKPDLRDGFVLGGLVLAALGIGFYSWPAGLVALGIGLMALGLLRRR